MTDSTYQTVVMAEQVIRLSRRMDRDWTLVTAEMEDRHIKNEFTHCVGLPSKNVPLESLRPAP